MKLFGLIFICCFFNKIFGKTFFKQEYLESNINITKTNTVKGYGVALKDTHGVPLMYGRKYNIITGNEFMTSGQTGTKDSVQVVSTIAKEEALIFKLCKSLYNCEQDGDLLKEGDSFYAYSPSINRWLDDYYGYIVLDRSEDTDPIYYFTLKQCKDNKNCKIASSKDQKWIYNRFNDPEWGGDGYFYTTPWNSLFFQFDPLV